MREILFRGKRVDNGEWAYGDFGQVSSDEGTYAMIFARNCKEFSTGLVDPVTVGQYTGLTDKNGVKIFEGDICKSSLGLLFAVIWDEENARFLGFTIESERRLIYVGREPKVEIVGNIHDNPDLPTWHAN